MSKSEAEVQAEVQTNAFGKGCVLMRNNSGVLKDVGGRPVRFGLGNVSKQQNDNLKSSDLVGFTRITVTPEMVGHTLAVFTAVEVKEEGWKRSPTDKRERAQDNFIRWIKANGGFAGFANCLNDLYKILAGG